MSTEGTEAPREGMETELPRVRELILASAGSGKTFRISSRIIGLLAGGETPGSIFASTFTRKAAGEILERVLVRLARAALDRDEAAALSHHGRLTPDHHLEPDPAFWQAVLHRTARELHRLDVSTLDAFFVRTVGSFAHELGLPPGWGIADEPTAARLMAETLDEVLARDDRGVLVELVRSLHGGKVKRSVHEALAGEVGAILAIHRDLDPEAPGWSALRQALPTRPGDLVDRCRTLAERIRAAEVPTNKSGAPDKRFLSARDKAADMVREGRWDDLMKTKIFSAATGEEEAVYYGVPIPPDLLELHREARAMARLDLGTELAERSEAMGRLGESYRDTHERRLLDSGQLRFDDVTRLLTGIRPLGGREDLFYRLDGSTVHLLLDEFQDTSLLQWGALVPLADGLLRQGGGTGVIVADPKQSIYGWRGAAPVVVDDLDRRYDLDRGELTRSFRSSPVVLEAVNTLFGGIREHPVLAEDEVFAGVADDWLRAFTPHTAAPRDEALPGHVVVRAGPPRDGKGKAQPAFFQHVALEIRDLHRQAPGRSIGVLTRTNATVGRIIHELRELGIPASGEGGTPLPDSAAVSSVLALLRLADHPGDGMARYQVAMTPVGEAEGFTAWDDIPGAARLSRRLRRRLLEDGYGPTLSELVERLRDACSPREALRLRALVEVGYRYDGDARGPRLRVDDFVRLVESTRAESPGEDRVRVMTVHRSKGLEFDAVVLPELHGELFREGRAPLARRSHGTGPVTHAFPYVRKPYRPLFHDIPELGEAVAQERAGVARDALGGLYVAMTRARYALHMIIPADPDKGVSGVSTAGRLVRDILGGRGEEEVVEQGETLYEAPKEGGYAWAATAPRKDAAERVQLPPAPGTIRLKEGPRTRILQRRTPSGEEGGGRVDLRLVLGLEDSGAARERGTLVHGWLERLEWTEDGLPPDRELLDAARRIAPTVAEAEAERTLAWLRDRLDRPGIREILSRSSWPGGAEVERELPFLHREGDALMEGYVDRLVVVREEGRVVRATVMDYKTDRVEGDDLAARARHYAPQVRAYRRAVAGLFGLDEETVSGLLLFLEAGVVREVD